MNKLLKVLAASALVATVLVGCGKKGESTGGAAEGAKYAKAGFGMIIEPGDTTSTTMATVGLDAEGKINYIDVDVIQTPNGKDETKTKKELKEDYGMKSTSAQMGKIEGGAEWYEQIAKFEEFCKGKTLDEVAAIETEKRDEEHTSVPKSGSDLAAGCTMDIGAFKEAVAKAGQNMTEVNAAKIGSGEVASWDGEQKNTTTAAVALDADGKAVWAYVDVSQNPNGKDESKSKKELQSDYGMKSTSAQIGNIEGGAEWYEQAATFEKYVVGKTAEEVAATETEKRDEEHTSVPKSGSDLAAGCTMDIGAFLEAVAEAFANAQ